MNRVLFCVLASSLFLGCGDDDTPEVDGGGTDAGRDAAAESDGGELDAGSAEDAGTSDAGAEDAGTTEDSGVDATVDAGVDAGGCDYVAVDEVVVRCDGTLTFVSQFTSDDEACGTFYGFTPDGERFDDYASAIGSDPSCDAGCTYRFSTSVTRLYCGRRTGYEILRADGCDDVYRFPEGYYASVEEHDAAHPCPDA